MNVETIVIDKAAARAKLASYRKAIAARAHKAADDRVRREYEQIEAGYRAAARGLPLIELTKAMRTGGWDEKGRPRFAVARADKKQMAFHVGHNAELCFSALGSSCWHRRSTTFRFRLSGMPQRPTTNSFNLRAIVPMIPPDVLKRPDCDLSRRVILWEADWQEAPVDPMLLLPIGGDLYAVEAAWDLTPLERAVIAGRLTT